MDKVGCSGHLFSKHHDEDNGHSLGHFKRNLFQPLRIKTGIENDSSCIGFKHLREPKPILQSSSEVTSESPPTARQAGLLADTESLSGYPSKHLPRSTLLDLVIFR
ncbi:hypothetical protein J6590_014438 [Homalodisca vitripennis]|nr:hypothetical protein J6590_014438 [Homalodisca vitripennis]